MIQAIIFGLWETLGSKGFSASRELKSHFNIKQPEFLAAYEKSMQLQPWETIEAMAGNFLKSFNLQISQENKDHVVHIIQKSIDQAELFHGVKNLLKELSKRYKLAILSNTNNFESTVVNKWDISHFFDEQFYSWQTGILKPSPESLKKACQELNVLPNECFFVDNEIRSLSIANKLNFQSIKFTNVENLKTSLWQKEANQLN